MPPPRPVLPGKTYIVTRRCTQRQFLLNPSAKVNAIIGYCLSVASERFSIEIHAACFLSNHYHLVLSDPLGKLPDFMERLNGMLARALNAHYGRCENLFDSGRYNCPALESEEDILEKIIYTLANPVAAGLVEKGCQWPGVWIGPLGLIKEKRPEKFFRPRETQCEKTELRTTKPEALSSMTEEEYRNTVLKLLRDREREIAAILQEEDRKVLGAEAVLAQSPFKEPTTTPTLLGELNPRIVARCKELREKLIERMRSFVSAYREALARFRSGERDVVFPAGTWLPRKRYGVCCADP